MIKDMTVFYNGKNNKIQWNVFRESERVLVFQVKIMYDGMGTKTQEMKPQIQRKVYPACRVELDKFVKDNGI